MKTRNRSAHRAPPVALALVATLALAACSSDDDDDDAVPDEDDALAVTLTTEQEVPPPQTPAPDAMGEGSISVDEDGAISGQVTVEGLTGDAQAAHIHRGFPGMAGPVAITLEPDADNTVWSVPADANLATTTLGDVRDAYARGELYFNVHTAANGSGEIRGQIVPTGDDAPTTFTVRIANVSTEQTLPISTEPGSVAVPLSPGAYTVHREDASPLLEPRDPASEALEQVAEDGDASGFDAMDIPVFDTPVGADAPGAIGPGDAYEFDITAVPGDKLAFVTMFVQSNDWFYTPTDEDDDSISLFGDDDAPISGVVPAEQIGLWDAGTEQDETPGEGPNQAPRQAAPNTGPDEGATVGSLASQGKSVDLNGAVIEVTVTPATQ